MRLQFNREKCIGCKLCQLACSSVKELTFNPLQARLAVNSYYSGSSLCVEGRVCTLCGVCVDECPADAISLEEGKLKYNQAECTSCNICVEMCPEKVIVSLKEGVAICDLCSGEPNCVKWCPHSALVFGEVS